MKLSENTLDLIEQLRNSGQSFCVATVVRTKDATSAKPGAKAVITVDGELHGFLGGNCVTGAVRKEALQALEAQQPKMIRIRPKEEVVAPVDTDGTTLHKSSCPSGGTVEIFLEPMKATRRLIILGSSPIARTLIAIAGAIGYRTISGTPQDETGEMARADACFDDFAKAASQAGPEDALILSTQGRRDREALKAALASRAGYIGMVASRRKFASLVADLPDEPQLRARAEVIHAPAGLDIKAVEPEEIALSIMGEVIALRRSGQMHHEAGSQQEAAGQG
ncbi:XdhC family protein [Hoeflea prorocentri]|uniref:XdhC family protein n=1 Tax=Hoeflea prorocentri TaxID=1922333 RepID=A0A9X3UEB6_9HYPH|nr:XdhC family protein [Hoeflea prorocentri]MCY6379161.1 XdhC family protein [Hoeflea prorocentri]MDA5396962.1 XdhC family protein [Hoeflea prorocentri]